MILNFSRIFVHSNHHICNKFGCFIDDFHCPCSVFKNKVGNKTALFHENLNIIAVFCTACGYYVRTPDKKLFEYILKSGL